MFHGKFAHISLGWNCIIGFGTIFPLFLLLSFLLCRHLVQIKTSLQICSRWPDVRNQPIVVVLRSLSLSLASLAYARVTQCRRVAVGGDGDWQIHRRFFSVQVPRNQTRPDQGYQGKWTTVTKSRMNFRFSESTLRWNISDWNVCIAFSNCRRKTKVLYFKDLYIL